jgi:thymidylate synthase (FAD)
MKFIKPSVEIVPQEPDLKGIYKMIELAGRTCYKSEDKITEDSAKVFVDRMIASGHGAMLEFGTVYLYIPVTANWEDSEAYYIFQRYRENKYSKAVGGIVAITTNYRVLLQGDYDSWDEAQRNNYNKNWLDDLQYLSEPTEYHEKRVCAKFITDRGVSHELVRHRVFSFAQESTRYCNYSKDKFGNELTFIIPSWANILEGDCYWHEGIGYRVGANRENLIDDSSFGLIVTDGLYNSFIHSLDASERDYLSMLKKCTPQQARQVLPNALKTEINMCGFTSDWKHFFELRDNPKAHPDMQVLAKSLHQQFIDNELL